MRRLVPLVACIGIALAVAGCQAHSSSPASNQAGPAAALPAVSGQPAPPNPPSGAASRAGSQPGVPSATVSPKPPTKSPTKPAPAEIALADACNQEVLRSSVQGLAPDMTTGVGRVKVYYCVKGFARLSAVPNLDAKGQQPGYDQFFLQFTAGHWHVLVRGVGIDCGDGDPKLAEACAAFASVA